MEPFIQGLKQFIVSQQDFTTDSSLRPNAFYTIKSVAKIQIPCSLKSRIKNGGLTHWLNEIEFLDIVFEGTFDNELIGQNAAGQKNLRGRQMAPMKNHARPVKPVTELVSPRIPRLQEKSNKLKLKTPKIVKVSIPLSSNSSEKHHLNLVTYQKLVPDASRSSDHAGSHLSSTYTETQVMMDEKPLQHSTTQIGLQGTSNTSPRKRKRTSQNQVPDSFKQLDLNPKIVLEKITPEILNSSGMKMNLRVCEERQTSTNTDIYIDNAEQNFVPPDLKKEFIEQEHESWLPNKDLESSKNSTKKVDSQAGENSRFRRSKNKSKMADEYLSESDFEDFSEAGVDENDSSDDSWHPDDQEDLPVVFQKNILCKESRAIPEKAETQKPKIQSGSEKSKGPGTVTEVKVKQNRKALNKILDADNSKIVEGGVEKLKMKNRKSSANSLLTGQKCPSDRRHRRKRKQLEGEGHSYDTNGIETNPQKLSKKHVPSYLTCKFCEEKFYEIRPFNIHVESHFNNEGIFLSVEQEPSTSVTREIPNSDTNNTDTNEIPTNVTGEIPEVVSGEIPTSVTREIPTSVTREITNTDTNEIPTTSVTRDISEVVSGEISIDNMTTSKILEETDGLNTLAENVQSLTNEELTQILAVKDEMSEVVLNPENDIILDDGLKESSEPVQRVENLQIENHIEERLEGIITTDPNGNDGKLPRNHSDRHFKAHPRKNYDILSCEKCPYKYFKSIAGYNIHIKTCSSEETRQTSVCHICDKEFSNPSGLHKHNKGMHPQNLLFSCTICNDDVKFRTKRALINHKKEVHLSEKLHVCHICGKSYNKKTKLKYHLYRHSEIKPFQCQSCEKAFASQYFLRLHFKQVHVRQFIYQCEKCGKSCKTPGALKAHQSVHSNVRNFVCHICNMAFKSPRSLKRHLPSHDAKPNSFKCDLCEKSFSSKVNLKRHNITAHTDTKPFKCEFCDKAFKLNSLLAQHSRVHKFEKDFSCQFCGKTFSFNSSLHSHLKCHHQSEMSEIKATEDDITCYICGKICTSNYSLSVHLRTHTTA